MKVIYLTDIHDALKELRVLLTQTEADLYFVSGDILYKAFYDEEKIYQFVCLQEEFYSIVKDLEEYFTPMDLATDILRFPARYKKYNPKGELEHKARTYRRLFEIATRTMKEKYELIEELIEKYSHAPALVLPGNYDLDLRYTALQERDMHHRHRHINGFEIAGYGGAPIATSGIPEKLVVVYHEVKENGAFYSEPQAFFEEVRPDIILLHNPAWGFFDKIPGIGHVGGIGSRNYLDDFSPALVLSGHVHEDYGVACSRGTVYLNPSNFGGVDSPAGWQSGGAFAEIYFENRQVSAVHFRRLMESKTLTLLKVRLDGKEWRLLEPIPAECKSHCHLDLNMLVRDAHGNPWEQLL
ncbi:MAG: metallophosphoesterase [Leptospiraceae bacterium]|nr:metallophosphoesterase [Leptospiraceae bacterium]